MNLIFTIYPILVWFYHNLTSLTLNYNEIAKFIFFVQTLRDQNSRAMVPFLPLNTVNVKLPLLYFLFYPFDLSSLSWTNSNGDDSLSLLHNIPINLFSSSLLQTPSLSFHSTTIPLRSSIQPLHFSVRFFPPEPKTFCCEFQLSDCICWIFFLL